MTDRDELIALLDGLQDVGRSRAYMIADALIAAGWSSPRDERMERIIEAMGADDWDEREAGQ